MEFYELHTSRDCTEINFWQQYSLGAVLWSSTNSIRAETAQKLILAAIFTWCGTVEFYALHTSIDCTEINSGSNIHLVRYCGVLRTPYEHRLHRN